MTRNLLRAGALSCALLTSTCLTPATAIAQTFSVPSPRPAPDENGVDVISGSLNSGLRSVSIGSGNGGLTYQAGWQGGAFVDTFDLSLGMFGGTVPIYVNLQGHQVYLVEESTNVYRTTDGDGARVTKLAGGWLYTTRDGTEILFSDQTGVGDGILRGAHITRPDGEQLTIHYRIAPEIPPGPDDPIEYGGTPGSLRVQSITSNLGYQLKATYAENSWTAATVEEWHRLTKVTALNNAVDSCNPTADSCTFSLGWPELNLGESTSGSTTTETFTDNQSNTTTVSTTGSTTTITSPGSSTPDVSFTTDSSGRVSSITRGGGTWSYSYSQSGGQYTTTVTPPIGGTRTYVSDGRRLLSATDELNRTTSYQYDSNGRVTRITRPEGNYTSLTYDARGNVTETRQVAKPGSGLADIVTSASFPSTCGNARTCNQPTSTTDARGNVTDYTYDSSHGGVLTVTAPAPTSGATRPQTRFSYSSLSAWYRNATGSIVQAATPVYRLTATSACQTGASCASTADEVKTSIGYGTGSSSAANNLLPVTVSSGAGDNSLTATVTRAYDAFGDVTSEDGPLAGTADTTGFQYDASRRLVMTVSPDPDGAGSLPHRAQRLTYDGDGNVTKVEAGTTTSLTGTFSPAANGERVEHVYDSLGRPTVEKLISGTSTVHSLTQTSYDARGRVECVAQRMNPAEFGSLPADACTLDTQGTGANDFGPDRIVRNVYDNANQLTQVQTGYGVTGVQATEVSATYRANGQVETLQDGENNLTTYVHDGHDRLSRTHFPVAAQGANSSSTNLTTGDYEELTYDAAGNVTQRRLRDGQAIAFTHDALNRVTQKDLPGSEATVTYAYDLLGRLTSATQGSHTLGFTYDALGGQLTQTNANGTVTSQFDAAGRRTRLTWPDAFYVTYDHLVTGEMSHIRENGAASGSGVLATFGYDSRGRRTSLTRGNGAVTSYIYDAAGRLATQGEDLASTNGDQSFSFAYNPAGQITSRTAASAINAPAGIANQNVASTHNGRNQIAAIGSTTISHDARGNIAGDPGPATGTGGARSYAYSSENLLTSMTNNFGTFQLKYDPLMRLHEVAGWSGPRLQYDGADLIAEYSASGAVERRHVFGPGVDEPLVWYEGSGTPGSGSGAGATRRYQHADERGSPVTVSSDTGMAYNTHGFDEYGNHAGLDYRFQFTGQTWFRELGLLYYKARFYDPRQGRFLQPDPIGYGDGMNMYTYVGGDPVNRADPTGTDEIEVFGSRFGEALRRINEIMLEQAINEIIVTGWRNGRLGGRAIQYNRNLEMFWAIRSNFEVVYRPLRRVRVQHCSDGRSIEHFEPIDPLPTDTIAVAHAHQNLRRRNAHGDPQDPFPGPGDAEPIPNFGLSSIGVWVIRPGSPPTASLLAGSWGSGFDPQTWSARFTQGGGNANQRQSTTCEDER